MRDGLMIKMPDPDTVERWILRGAHSAFDSNPELCVAGLSLNLGEPKVVVPAATLERAEAERDSLRLERDGLEHVRKRDNEYLLDRARRAEAERDAARIALKHGEQIALDRIRRAEAERDRLAAGLRQIIRLDDDPMCPAAPLARAILEEVLGGV